MFVIVAKLPNNAHISQPVGSIVNWTGSAIAASDGVIPCDGRWLSITEHLPLFLAIGYEYTEESPLDTYRDGEGALCLDRASWGDNTKFQVPSGDSIIY